MKNDALKTEKYKGHIIEIYQDVDPISPREDDNICVIHTAHKRYNFGDVDHSSLESIKKAEKEAEDNGDIILPLYMYDHSGVTISLNPFSCPWDSGQVGIVVVSRKKILEEFGGKKFTAKLKEKALKIAENEVKDLDSYIRGDIYGFVIDNSDDSDDSCWGFYGEEEALSEAKGIVDYRVENVETVEN